MPLLSKKLFSHSNNSNSHLNDHHNYSTNNHNNEVKTTNTNDSTLHNDQTAPPLLKRSSKSFLSFISRKQSMDSIKSDKSNDSNYVINHINNNSNNNNIHNITSPGSNYIDNGHGHGHGHAHGHGHHSNSNSSSHLYSDYHLNTSNGSTTHHNQHPSHHPHNQNPKHLDHENGTHVYSQNTHTNYNHNHHNGSNPDLHNNVMSPKPSYSMAELKRFFRPSKKSMVNLHNLSTTNTTSSSIINTGGNNTHSLNPLHGISSSISRDTHNNSSNNSIPANHHPYSTTTLNLNAHYQHSNHPTNHKSHTNSAIPPTSDSVLSLSNTINIYHDDTLLAQKYGKLGKTLGSGAGGSVKVLVRPTDGKTFAVKEFRPRKSNESIKQYAKKCTAEFCIGSSLHHPNVVQTIDIFSDFHQNKYFQVMEYLPVDFFAVVMTGLMSRGEIICCFKQIVQGVRYLHSMGLAHRDLKLDNCCMNEKGILKLIDFGSAVVFRYPFEKDISMAHGIVGSDPYLAPEVITSTKEYDPQFVDIWSMGIIFCCMMLKRFPWKKPKLTDDNFKLYSMPDDFPHDYNQSAKHHEQLLKERRERRECAKREQESKDCNEKANVNNENNQLPTPTTSVNENTDDKNNETNKNNNETNNNNNNDNDDNSTTTKINDTNDTNTNKNEVEKAVEDEQGNSKEDNHDKANAAEKKIPAPAPAPSTTSSTITAVNSNNQHSIKQHGKKVIHGPYRLLRLLPHASRPILSKILEIDPKKRATLIDIFDDEWFDEIPYCTIDTKGSTVRSPGHHHTIVKGDKTYKV